MRCILTNRKIERAIRRGDYVAASWYQAHHYRRLGQRAILAIEQGRTAFDFSR